MLPRKTIGIGRKRLKKRSKPKNKKDGSWSLEKADAVFSAQIRARDGRCMHPMGTEDCVSLQNSHYIGRVVKNTRFDPDNCITLCWYHHYKSKDLGYEYQKQTKEKHGFDGQYTLFMKNHLGPERFAALIERSKVHITQSAAIKRFQSSSLHQPI